MGDYVDVEQSVCQLVTGAGILNYEVFVGRIIEESISIVIRLDGEYSCLQIEHIRRRLKDHILLVHGFKPIIVITGKKCS